MPDNEDISCPNCHADIMSGKIFYWREQHIRFKYLISDVTTDIVDGLLGPRKIYLKKSDKLNVPDVDYFKCEGCGFLWTEFDLDDNTRDSLMIIFDENDLHKISKRKK